MVYISKPVIVAALVITPVLAVPISQVKGSSQETGVKESKVKDQQVKIKKRLSRTGTAGRLATRALNHAGTVASVGSMLQARDVSDDEIEAREPKIDVRTVRRLDRGVGRVLDHASTAADVASMFRSREFNDEVDARDLEDSASDNLEARGRGLALAGAASAALAAGAGLGQMLAPIFRRPKNPTYKREFNEDDMSERDFDEDEFIAREEYAELEERAPIRASSLLKLGTALGKSAKYVVPAAGAAGLGLGVAAKLRSRDFDEDEFVAREEYSELDERSPIRAASLLKFGSALGKTTKYAVPAAGAAGFGLGVAAKLRSRDFDEGLDLYEREVGSSLDELD